MSKFEVSSFKNGRVRSKTLNEGRTLKIGKIIHGVLLDYFTKKNRTGACCMFLESPDPTGFKKCEIEIPAVRFFLGGFCMQIFAVSANFGCNLLL